MHYYDAKGGTGFNYNEDFSGQVTIITKPDATGSTKRIEIPAADLIQFVAYEYVLKKRIASMMLMDADEVLGLFEEELDFDTFSDEQ